ncbi:uncharacterized protein [Physcomitrium patens]|uniref:uncharacterized protein n=1 Tax=Physcomitrium patens TaxID=3218 RepID=UPI003CCD4505
MGNEKSTLGAWWRRMRRRRRGLNRIINEPQFPRETMSIDTVSMSGEVGGWGEVTTSNLRKFFDLKPGSKSTQTTSTATQPSPAQPSLFSLLPSCLPSFSSSSAIATPTHSIATPPLAAIVAAALALHRRLRSPRVVALLYFARLSAQPGTVDRVSVAVG